MAIFTVAFLIAKPLNKSVGECDLVMIKTFGAFQMQITLLLCLLDTGLYHNKATFKLT